MLSPLLLLCTAASPVSPPLELPQGATHYIQNRGQWPAEAVALSRSNGMDLWLTSQGAVINLFRVDRETVEDPGVTRGHAIEMSFVGARAGSFQADFATNAQYNYFIGRDTAKHAKDVPAYRQMTARSLYPGVDARWTLQDERPRYDLIVAPGADPSQVRIRFDGAESARVTTEGKLALGTRFGEIDLRGLHVFQPRGQDQDVVPAAFVQTGPSEFGFRLGAYDKTRELVIDPVIHSTLIGGLVNDVAADVDLADDGSTSIVGTTRSADFPTTFGAYDGTYNGSDDVVVVAVRADGGSIRATYVGGSASDVGQAIATPGGRGSVRIVGHTSSADFPVTADAYDSTLGGARDGFLLTMPSPNTLSHSTYFGGGASDEMNVVTLGGSSDVWVAGRTGSTDLPVSSIAPDRTYAGSWDAFVMRYVFLESGPAVAYCTYLGGGGSESVISLERGRDGKLVFGCSTNSTDYPVTFGAYQSSLQGVTDAAITWIDPELRRWRHSTYLGSSNTDVLTGLTLLPDGSVAAAGITYGTTFPTTPGADATRDGPSDAYLTRFGPDFGLKYSSYVGGAGVEQGAVLASNWAGEILMAISTDSKDLPVTPEADQPAPSLEDDIYLARRAAGGDHRVIYATYWGATGDDWARAVSANRHGMVAFAGRTTSVFFPTNDAAFDRTQRGGDDMYSTALLPRPFEKSSIAWLNGTTVQMSQVRQGDMGVAQTVATIGSGWSVAGFGDFDRNGHDDLVLFRESDRLYGRFTLDENGVLGWAQLGRVPGGWTLAGFLDVDLDGHVDVLIQRNSDGLVGAYLMRGDQIRAWQTVAGALPGSKVVGRRMDTDSLVFDQFLLRVTPDGHLVMSAIGGLGLPNIDTGPIPAGWTAVEVGDFDTNGRWDMMMYRPSDRALGTWDAVTGELMVSGSLPVGTTLAGAGRLY